MENRAICSEAPEAAAGGLGAVKFLCGRWRRVQKRYRYWAARQFYRCADFVLELIPICLSAHSLGPLLSIGKDITPSVLARRPLSTEVDAQLSPGTEHFGGELDSRPQPIGHPLGTPQKLGELIRSTGVLLLCGLFLVRFDSLDSGLCADGN